MSLDRSVIGREFAPVSLLVTRSRLQNFAKATGQSDPIYTDVDAAKQAGHRDLPVPPTFVFGIELEAPNPFAFLEDLGVDLRTVLHGEQQFDYPQMAYAGDELTAASRITDIYEKKGGLLEFIVKETTVTNQDGARVAVMRSATVVQHRPRKDT
ncbi:MaoC family dehydratase (plasmid) [Rhodococcus pyridinivorans]|uniref:MaoC family dehydratase N-terminal domain-containing protein n=1 Tax=Rhodococcus pyridinivorans TaxID=103816 RepID=UPI001C310697|nr:MaoC family dehydratase N-terminal domain-containing protein [Rhodococcus pyridinivorans]QXF84174.1 MaoC family dehydratase [Rhodococcus pyridinivorans]QXF84439.1 MaoC family dehydratase [Rhodococcus pyridinivorans]